MNGKLGLGGHLRVRWDPRDEAERDHGRVLGNTIYVYDREMEEVLHMVRHELLEYILTREVLKPGIMEIRLHR